MQMVTWHQQLVEHTRITCFQELEWFFWGKKITGVWMWSFWMMNVKLCILVNFNQIYTKGCVMSLPLMWVCWWPADPEVTWHSELSDSVDQSPVLTFIWRCLTFTLNCSKIKSVNWKPETEIWTGPSRSQSIRVWSWTFRTSSSSSL